MNLVNLNIRHAIKHRLIIEFEYNRVLYVVEPFVYGVSTKGFLALMAFQFTNEKEKTGKWAVFDLDATKNIKIHCERFDVEIRKNYEKVLEEMKITYAKVWK